LEYGRDDQQLASDPAPQMEEEQVKTGFVNQDNRDVRIFHEPDCDFVWRRHLI
jgi:hypothetical protein